MSDGRNSSQALAPTPDELLCGWGRTAATRARVLTPEKAGEAVSAIAGVGRRGIIARGLGRSYGDAAGNAGGSVLSTARLDRLVDLDLTAGRARVGAGVSLDWLMRTLVPLGWWPAVTPGTRQVTVGGAISSDIHGKNHHRDGTFAAHTPSVLLATPAFGPIEVSAKDDPEVFWATAGGMGLTGVILEATIDLLPIETSMMRVESRRCNDLDALMAAMLAGDPHHRYSVAWIDGLARGGHLGRSILEFGEHARRDELPPSRRSPAAALRFSPFDRAPAPAWVPSGLLNRGSVAAFNELWFRRSSSRPTSHLVAAATFFHPLDLVSGWNRIYGRRGFVQYQLVLPDGEEDALRRCVERLSAARCASFLSVLKRFGPANEGLLSFPRPGWTLALDIPAAAAGLGPLLDGLDELVVSSGGAVYLAKDSRLRPDLLPLMYPRLDRWRRIRDRLDPDRVLNSDLARRLGLHGPVRPDGGVMETDS